MSFPTLTVQYLALLALIYSALALVVVALRARNDIPFGDGGNETLHRAIRAHGNFIEWVPLAALLVGALEASGDSARWVHGLMGALLAARVLHPIAFASPLESLPYYVGRIAGAFTSWAVVTVAAARLLLRA